MPQCLEWTSQRLYKDGVRQTNSDNVQRYLCRDCGYRFSEMGFSKSFNTASGKGSISQVGSDPFAHGQVINLAAIEPLKGGPAGATTISDADLKGKIVQFFCFMEKQGYAEAASQTYFQILRMLVKNGANLNDQESVKEVIAKQNCGKGRK